MTYVEAARWVRLTSFSQAGGESVILRRFCWCGEPDEDLSLIVVFFLIFSTSPPPPPPPILFWLFTSIHSSSSPRLSSFFQFFSSLQSFLLSLTFCYLLLQVYAACPPPHALHLLPLPLCILLSSAPQSVSPSCLSSSHPFFLSLNVSLFSASWLSCEQLLLCGGTTTPSVSLFFSVFVTCLQSSSPTRLFGCEHKSVLPWSKHMQIHFC